MRIILFFVALTILSPFVVKDLRIDLLPKQQKNELLIQFNVPNATPTIIEQQITAILENALSQLTDLKNIDSNSQYNEGYIHLEFSKKADLAMKKFEIATLLRRIYPKLPLGVSYPIIQEFQSDDFKDRPLLSYTIEAPQAAFEVKKQSEEIFFKRLLNIKGVREVQILGVPQVQLTLEYDPIKSNLYGISPTDLAQHLQTFFREKDIGSVFLEEKSRFFIQIKAPVADISTIEKIVLKKIGKVPIRFKDIAKVYLEEQEPNTYFRINGKNSVTMQIFVHEGENVLRLATQIRAMMSAQKSFLPQAYVLRLDIDNTTFLAQELRKTYQRVAISMAILLAFMLLSYRNGRLLIILIASLVVSLALTLLLTWIFQIPIHLYTMAGLAIAFGLIIDNAIVMLDYYHQYRHRNVFLSIFAANLTTISALLLTFLLPEQDRIHLTDFVKMISLALLVSMLTVLGFIPALYTLIRPSPFSKSTKLARIKVYFFQYYERFIAFLATWRKSFMVFLLFSFGVPIFLLPNHIHVKDNENIGNRPFFAEIYNKSIGSVFYQERLKPYLDKWTGGAVRLFARNVYEKSGYRSYERTRIYVHAELPFGNTPAQMNFILSRMEAHLATIEGIEKYITNVYSGQFGTIEIIFEPQHEEAELPYLLKNQLVARSLDWSGVAWTIYGVGQGFSTASGNSIAAFRVLLKGFNYDELERQTLRLAKKLGEHPRVQRININEKLNYEEKSTQEYHLNVDAKSLALLGSNQAEMIENIKNKANPTTSILQIKLQNAWHPLFFKQKNSENYSNFDVLNQPLGNLKLKNMATLNLEDTQSSIRKKNREYLRVLGFDYMGSENFGSKYLDETLKSLRQEMPVGYTAERDSYNWWNTEKTKREYGLILILLLANFVICAILLESLRQAFFIILTVPLAFIGLMLAFAWGDFYFDQGGYAAFVLLSGIVVNAALFILNDYNRFPEKNRQKKPNRLLLKAVYNRTRTIILTSFSMICGFIPYLIEGQNEVFWFSLAVGTIGGLLMSLVVVLVVLPVVAWKK